MRGAPLPERNTSSASTPTAIAASSARCRKSSRSAGSRASTVRYTAARNANSASAKPLTAQGNGVSQAAKKPLVTISFSTVIRPDAIAPAAAPGAAPVTAALPTTGDGGSVPLGALALVALLLGTLGALIRPRKRV